jgi:putative endonuclease
LVPGFYAVDKRKKRALKRAARAYLRTFKNRPNTFRLDVVEVNHQLDEAWEILHFSNVDWS